MPAVKRKRNKTKVGRKQEKNLRNVFFKIPLVLFIHLLSWLPNNYVLTFCDSIAKAFYLRFTCKLLPLYVSQRQFFKPFPTLGRCPPFLFQHIRQLTWGLGQAKQLPWLPILENLTLSGEDYDFKIPFLYSRLTHLTIVEFWKMHLVYNAKEKYYELPSLPAQLVSLGLEDLHNVSRAKAIWYYSIVINLTPYSSLTKLHVARYSGTRYNWKLPRLATLHLFQVEKPLPIDVNAVLELKTDGETFFNCFENVSFPNLLSFFIEKRNVFIHNLSQCMPVVKHVSIADYYNFPCKMNFNALHTLTILSLGTFSRRPMLYLPLGDLPCLQCLEFENCLIELKFNCTLTMLHTMTLVSTVVVHVYGNDWIKNLPSLQNVILTESIICTLFKGDTIFLRDKVFYIGPRLCERTINSSSLIHFTKHIAA